MNIDYEKTLFIKAPNTRLSDVLDDLPDNVYLNKTSTGCGATHLCLTNDVNYVVIVPYRSAIHNKTNKNSGISNIIAVEGGVAVESIISAVEEIFNKGIHTTKIMTTYDSFYKVYEALASLGLLKEFKLCIDESHVLTTLAKIKGKCFNFLYKHFKEFKSFVFVTATPNDKTLIPKAIQDVEFVRVVWELSDKVNITEQRVDNIADCNKYVIEICKQHLLGEVDGNAYIYYNSVNEIISVIKKLKNMDGFNESSVNIFCAENPYNDKKVTFTLGKGFTNGSFSDNKKINFLTSSNYESCDILDPEGRTYIIVSSKRNSTALTNHLAVPQACGRLRVSKYKNEAIMIVCGFSNDIYMLKNTEFMSSLDKREMTAKHLIERALQSKELGFDEAYNKDLDDFSSNPFIVVNDDNTIEFNDGARLAEMQVYQAFNSYVITASNSNEIANTIRKVDDNKLLISDEAKLLIDEKVDFCRMLKKYIKAIEGDDVGLCEMIESKSNEYKSVVDVLGIDKIKAIGFNKTKIMTAYNIALKFNDNNTEIKHKLKQLKVGEKYTSSFILMLLQNAYDVLGLDRKAVSNDIKNYFVVNKTQVKGSDGKRKQGYLIVDDLYKSDV